MKGFWTCGPFKEAADKLETMVFKAEQMRIFMETLEEAEKIDEIIENGSTEEKLLASMVKLDVDKRIETKKRMMKYLERQYSNLSKESQKNKLEEVLSRLKNLNFLDEDTLKEVVQSLIDEEGWPLHKIIAHLDMIDHDERT